MAGVEAEEDGGGGVLEGVGGVVRVGEVVAGEGDDDLSVGAGEDALVVVDGVGVAGVPEGLDEWGEGGMRAALEVEHASPWWRGHLTVGKVRPDEAIVGQ